MMYSRLQVMRRKWDGNVVFKGSDSNFELNILKVATNETSTLHLTICPRITLELYNNNDQQFNRHRHYWTMKWMSITLHKCLKKVL